MYFLCEVSHRICLTYIFPCLLFTVFDGFVGMDCCLFQYLEMANGIQLFGLGRTARCQLTPADHIQKMLLIFKLWP